MADLYRFRIEGTLSPELLQTFSPTHARVEPQRTVFITAVRDPAELFGVIGRCETLGLKLLGMDQLPLDDKPER